MLTYLKANWKTTAAGLGALIYAGLKYWAEGTIDFEAIIVAFGFAAAKDVNVSGGSKLQ